MAIFPQTFSTTLETTSSKTKPVYIAPHVREKVLSQVMRKLEVEKKNFFTKEEINTLYNFSLEHINDSITPEEAFAKILNLRGGLQYDEALIALATFTLLIIILCDQSDAFVLRRPHLGWAIGPDPRQRHFGFGRNCVGSGVTLSSTNEGLTQNAGSENIPRSSTGKLEWNYTQTIEELKQHCKKKHFDIQLGEETYHIYNSGYDSVCELQSQLAEQIYDSIRDCDTDICDIARNLGFKAQNIKDIKEHVFYSNHTLDRYGPDETTYQRFDPDLRQALAWKRLEKGNFTSDDVTWIKHEWVERHHELKYNSGYDEAQQSTRVVLVIQY